ncbi:MAG TPA: flagellar motor switch protein FliN [Gemmatimonadaceae bacterium]|nr:flagellar motor switch protein FliN [Gemmatimonadaceae bacterium]
MNQADIDALTAAAQQSQVQRAPELNELGSGVTGNAEVPLAMLMDLTLPLSIELGRTRMTVQDILRLGRGSVVQLERLAGEPIDLYVADRRFAEGEVVVLGEHFGVRITRIVSNLAPEGTA